ncbi:MAG: hypothetical protein H6838_09540 [Planctomycetes bacterium]|nr:hypothetical protein [Planctomycetota bacterium]MCB9885724.1 hypothetical protein [Planctomycetota bacterium]
MSLTAITTLRRNLTEWADRPANRQFLHDDQVAQLEQSLGVPARRTQVHVAAWMLGSWHLGQGMVRVLNGDGQGFDEARIGQSMRRTSLLLRARQQTAPLRRGRVERLPFSLAHAAWTTLLGLALRDPHAEELYDLLRELPDGAFTENDHLALFVRDLLALRHGARQSPGARLGPYEGVLLHWTGEPRLLAQQLAEVLDLHIDEAQRRGGTFDDPGLQLYPAEALAVLEVRDWLELPRAKVDHPLMHTNLVTMKPSRTWPSHDLATALEQELRRR